MRHLALVKFTFVVELVWNLTDSGIRPDAMGTCQLPGEEDPLRTPLVVENELREQWLRRVIRELLRPT